jgi:hypothetical protein
MANLNSAAIGACALITMLAAPATAQTDIAQSETKPALACIFGMGPKGCETMFGASASRMSRGIIMRNGFTPNYLSASLVWHDDDNDDVWDVKFGELRAWQEQTYIISKPDPDGKIRRIAVLQGAPDHQCVNFAAHPAVGIRIRTSCVVLFSS